MNQLQQAIDLIKSKTLIHARFYPQFGGYVVAYKKDSTSPSGKIKAGSFDTAVWDEAVKISGDSRLSPLSPTELR